MYTYTVYIHRCVWYSAVKWRMYTYTVYIHRCMSCSFAKLFVFCAELSKRASQTTPLHHTKDLYTHLKKALAIWIGVHDSMLTCGWNRVVFCEGLERGFLWHLGNTKGRRVLSHLGNVLWHLGNTKLTCACNILLLYTWWTSHKTRQLKQHYTLWKRALYLSFGCIWRVFWELLYSTRCIWRVFWELL